MSFIDKPDLKYGFWIGLGLVLAFAVWNFFTIILPNLLGGRRRG